MKYLSAVVLSLVLISCSKEHHEPNRKYETVETSELQFNLTFPQKLWDEILEKAPLTVNIKKGAYETFVPLKTELEINEEKGNPLGGKNYKMIFEQFGADLDWNTYLDRAQGGVLNVHFRFPELEEGEEIKVYFLSWSQRREIVGEVFGNGCDKFFNLTKFYTKQIASRGLLLHTKDLRYLYATAGRFYFVSYKKDKVRIAQVSFTDSAQEKGIECPNKI